MSRRLSEMSEQALETGSRSARKAVEEAGFSEDLKRQLEDRIAGASFRSNNAQALAQSGLSSSAGAATRDLAGAQPWMGTESIADASLRMLNDAHKPMRVPVRPPSIRMPTKVDTGRPQAKSGGSGARIASARDKTSMYSYLKDPGLSEQERETMRKELKERFTPGSRSIPATLQGLASLANERIDDAIARGQFKNLPRGKKIERDHNASSPFLDTTEYFMNKIIQKQEIVPPWIEKQQELTSNAARFRGRLRKEWRRYVARLIASRGGTIESQVALAEAYARAEAVDNPPRIRQQAVAVDAESNSDGHMSQISPAGDLRASSAAATIGPIPESALQVYEPAPQSPIPQQEQEQAQEQEQTQEQAQEQEQVHPTAVAPFRDPDWLASEHSYHALAIQNLNSLARSYNLMAPNLARKPYFDLERELQSCYADVAPQVAEEIRQRGRAPQLKIEVIGHRPGGVMQRFAGAPPGRVFDEVRPQYGFKEFWRDLFAKQ